jgi:hypothetical protein
MQAILAISLHTAHQLQQVGLLVAGLGAIALVVVGVLGYRRVNGRGSESPLPERTVMIVAGLLLGLGYLIQLIGVHH